jgi:hypothetical protein
MPCSVQLEILPVMISPLKGRKTRRRNSTDSPFSTCRIFCHRIRGANTIDIDEAVTMTDKSIRYFEKIIHADAQSDLLDNLILASERSTLGLEGQNESLLCWSISR